MLTVPKLTYSPQHRRQTIIQNLLMTNLCPQDDDSRDIFKSDKDFTFEPMTATTMRNKQNCLMVRRKLQIDTLCMDFGQSNLKMKLEKNISLTQIGFLPQKNNYQLKKQPYEWTYLTSKKSKECFSPKYMKQRQENQKILQSLKSENEKYKKLLHQNQFLDRRERINSIAQFNIWGQTKKICNFFPKIKKISQKQIPLFPRKVLEEMKNLCQSLVIEDLKQISHFDFLLPNKNSNNLCSENLHCSDFQKIKFLGKGNFGEVNLVRHKKTNFICAMKTIKKSFVKQENVVHQISRQIRIHVSLKNLNVIGFYGFFDDSQNVYLLIEYATGGQLFKKLKQCYRMPQKDVVPIIRDVLDGLRKIHSMGYIHRDLKPENVIFQFGIAKICDMGWAAQCGVNNMRKSFCGTPLYLPPQMIRKEQYDQSADIWSAGILTYELLVGKVPFNIWSQWDLQLIVDKQIKFPTNYVDLSSNSINFMQKCLAKDPAQRGKLQELMSHPFLKTNQNEGYFNIQVYNAVEGLF